MRVSVVIPVYNAEGYVEAAAESALAQPETGEVLLVEDGSPDGSLTIGERLAEREERVQLLRHPGGENRGAAESRTLGVREARFPFVAFLDADDYYLPGRFKTAARVLSERPDVDGVYEAVGTHFESEAMRQWWAERGRSELSSVPAGVPAEELFETMLSGRNRSCHTNGVTVRRELFDRTGPFDAHLRMSQDFAMWLKMAAVGRLVGGSIEEPVAMRRLHGENRIVRQSDELKRYAYEMWRTLAEWADAQGLSPSRRRRLAQGMVSAWLALDEKARQSVAGHDSALRFLLGSAVRRPCLWVSQRYWRQVGRVCGGSRMRQLIRALAFRRADAVR